MNSTAAGEARFDFRLSRQHKELIEQAAAATGQSVSDFATSTLLEKAREVLQAESVRRLSERDARRITELLDAYPEPNEPLRAAGERYRKSRGRPARRATHRGNPP
jgi:uncharacterized protein (DUF1778 family)